MGNSKRRLCRSLKGIYYGGCCLLGVVPFLRFKIPQYPLTAGFTFLDTIPTDLLPTFTASTRDITDRE